jgi:hypothetical protein
MVIGIKRWKSKNDASTFPHPVYYSSHLLVMSVHNQKEVDKFYDRARPEGQVANAIQLDNILSRLSKEELMADVERFITTHGLEEHADSFRKGALVAQQPDNWNAISELSEEEKLAISEEHQHKWRQPRALYFTGEWTPDEDTQTPLTLL